MDLGNLQKKKKDLFDEYPLEEMILSITMMLNLLDLSHFL